jgi:hypothetical protein
MAKMLNDPCQRLLFQQRFEDEPDAASDLLIRMLLDAAVVAAN